MHFNNLIGQYYTWEIISQGNKDPKRENFLGTFGRIRPTGLSAQKGEVSLPLYRIDEISKRSSLMVTTKGFGSKTAQKLRLDEIRVVIMGICLFDGFWKAFTVSGDQIRLILSEERRKLTPNSNIQRVEIPVEPGDYHQRMITFQRLILEEVKKKWDGVEVYYHLPLTEYQRYLENLFSWEWKEKVKGPLLAFTEKVREEVKTNLPGVKFLDPLRTNREEVTTLQIRNNLSPETASYLWPYLDFSRKGPVLGIEDLTEYTLLSVGERVAKNWDTRSQIEMYGVFGVLGIPHPYISPESYSSDREVIIVQ